MSGALFDVLNPFHGLNHLPVIIRFMIQGWTLWKKTIKCNYLENNFSRPKMVKDPLTIKLLT